MGERKKVRWGIIGAGNIAHRFAKSLAAHPDGQLAAISCRTKEKGDAFAKEFDVPRTYIGHENLLLDDDIDAVYIALPHGLHKEWASHALRSGKAVLCEKPAVLNAAEMMEIADVAHETGMLFMEAMKPRFVPLYGKLKQIIDSGRIGDIERVETSLCNMFSFDPLRPTYHTDKVQGGCLLDEGIYCASWLEDFSEGEPQITDLQGEETDGVEFYINADITYSNISGSLECAFDRSKPRNAVIYGTSGKIVVEDLHRPQKFFIYDKDGDAPTEEIGIPYEVDDFYGEIDHFIRCMLEARTDSNIMPIHASVRCAQLIDIIKQKGDSNGEHN